MEITELWLELLAILSVLLLTAICASGIRIIYLLDQIRKALKDLKETKSI